MSNTIVQPKTTKPQNHKTTKPQTAKPPPSPTTVRTHGASRGVALGVVAVTVRFNRVGVVRPRQGHPGGRCVVKFVRCLVGVVVDGDQVTIGVLHPRVCFDGTGDGQTGRLLLHLDHGFCRPVVLLFFVTIAWVHRAPGVGVVFTNVKPKGVGVQIVVFPVFQTIVGTTQTEKEIRVFVHFDRVAGVLLPRFQFVIPPRRVLGPTARNAAAVPPFGEFDATKQMRVIRFKILVPHHKRPVVLVMGQYTFPIDGIHLRKGRGREQPATTTKTVSGPMTKCPTKPPYNHHTTTIQPPYNHHHLLVQ
jgi:hypothetical protein